MSMTETLVTVLLDIGVVDINTKEPFKLTSGKTSPIYFDCRKLISSPAAMAMVSGMWAWDVSIRCPDYIVGGESAGIPFAAHLSHSLGIPLLYARKGDRTHGKLGKIEGLTHHHVNSHAVLIEDMITDGGSKAPFIHAMLHAQIVCRHCYVVLDRQQGGFENLASEGVELHSLITAREVLTVGNAMGLICIADYEASMEALRR